MAAGNPVQPSMDIHASGDGATSGASFTADNMNSNSERGAKSGVKFTDLDDESFRSSENGDQFQKRLQFKNAAGSTKSWSSVDFRASFDQTRRASLIQDCTIPSIVVKLKTEISEELEEIEELQPLFSYSVVLPLRDLSQLAELNRIFQELECELERFESRASDAAMCDIYVRFCCPRPDLSLADFHPIQGLALFEEVWYPKSAEDLNRCRNILSSVEPDLDKDHPGFSDAKYRARRSEIATIALSFRHGGEIPRVEYTEVEVGTWREAYENLTELHESLACEEYKTAFKRLAHDRVIKPDEIPQLQDLSDYLTEKTNFRLCPVAGLVAARDFLACLAFRVFPCTQYMRHHAASMHSPEPDLIHEVLGHVVMFTNPLVADFSQKIGLASLGASDDFIQKLATLYWFTVEFGLIEESNGLKAFGAGLLSSYGELEFAVSDEPEHREFFPEETAVQAYDDYNYQTTYFVVKNFNQMTQKFTKYIEDYKQ